MGQNCIFCEIVARHAPSTLLYEDDRVISFLPLRPVTKGHIILATKHHFDDYTALPKDLSCHLTHISQRLGRILKEQLHPKKVGYMISGMEVEHTHIHILPLYKALDIAASACAHVKDGKLHWTEEHLPVFSDAERRSMANWFKDLRL